MTTREEGLISLSIALFLVALLAIVEWTAKPKEMVKEVVKTVSVVDSSAIHSLRDSLNYYRTQSIKVQIHRVTVHDTLGTETTVLDSGATVTDTIRVVEVKHDTTAVFKHDTVSIYHEKVVLPVEKKNTVYASLGGAAKPFSVSPEIELGYSRQLLPILSVSGDVHHTGISYVGGYSVGAQAIVSLGF